MKSEFASTHGKIVFTDSVDDAPALIFMHGLPTSKELWNPVLPLVAPGYRLVAFDLLDYGESEKIGRHISHEQRADSLDELRRGLGIKRFTLIAHDLGSSVALDYMGKYAQQVERLVVISPPVFPDFVEPALVKLVRIPLLGEALVLLIKRALFTAGIGGGMVHKERLTARYLDAFSNPFSGKDGRAALLRVLRWGRPGSVFKGYPSIMRSIRVPTLVIQGRQDPYIPLDQARRMVESVPDARLTLIEDGGHFLPIDTPQAVAREINAFLDQGSQA